MNPSLEDEPAKIDDPSINGKEDGATSQTEPALLSDHNCEENRSKLGDDARLSSQGGPASQGGTASSSGCVPEPLETPASSVMPTPHSEFRSFLAKVHVVDILPERSAVCTFDACLSIYEILSTLIAVCHRTRDAWVSDNPASEAGGSALQAEAVATFLASNVLAEVCEFSENPTHVMPQESDPKEAEEATEPAHRSWVGPDDGWGCQVEGEAMGWLQMPFTVQELSEFLLFSTAEESSVLDWDLSRWRRHKEETTGLQGRSLRHGSLFRELPTSTPSAERDAAGVIMSPSSTLMQLIQGGGAPPRPMLRIEEPESTFMTAVELLLAHPELDALPVVSMNQRTVVAHLTLSQCLALLVQHFRGPEIIPLAELMLSDAPQTFLQWHDVQGTRHSDAFASKSECICLDADKNTLFDLLDFFSKTNYTAVPVITEGNILVGVLGRRNLLQLLDLCMESSVRVKQQESTEEIPFDVTWSLRQVIETLEKYIPPQSRFFGAGMTTESLPMRIFLCEILLSDNHKVVLVEPQGENAILRRLIHVDEVMKLILYGDGEFPESLQSEVSLVEEA